MSFLRVLSVVVVISHFSALAASPPTGSRIDPLPGAVRNVDTAREDEAVRVMNQFARCIAKQRRARAEAVLALPYLSPEQSAATRKLVRGAEECLDTAGVELRFRPPAMMGGLAEQLILDRFKVADIEQVARYTEEEAGVAGLVARNTAEDFAICMALKDSKNIHALIATRPTGAQEAAVLAQISPQLGPCLLEGETLSLEKQSVRSLLAVGLYRALTVLTPRS